jgi:hypothetical protein
MTNPANQATLTATLRVMNSKNYLYLGLTINDDEFSTYGQALCCGDGFRIDFDNDNSGSLFALNDNVLFISAGLPNFIDGYIEIEGASSSWPDEHGGGTNNGIGFSSRQGSLNHFELRHPICSNDSLDFCLSPTNTVGFRLEYFDAQANGDFGGSYYYPGSTPTSLAQIVIGTCTVDDFFLYLPLVNK